MNMQRRRTLSSIAIRIYLQVIMYPPGWQRPLCPGHSFTSYHSQPWYDYSGGGINIQALFPTRTGIKDGVRGMPPSSLF